MFGKLKVGLALGSGGARGLAHLGVIKALERGGIPIHIITGSSIGALIGGMYAQTLDIHDVEERLTRFFTGGEFRKTGLHLFKDQMHPENFFGQVAHESGDEVLIRLDRRRLALMKTNRLGIIMDGLLGDGLIENTRIKFGPVATNLQTGEIVVFRSGSIREAIKASSSIPGFLPPLEYRGLVLVDGAVAAPIPVEPAFALGADMVIAVNVSRPPDHDPMPLHVIDILFRTSQITVHRHEQMACARADLVIRPDVGDFQWAEFDRIAPIVALGESAADASVENIRRLLHKRFRKKPNGSA